jgi:hypothetical protein
MKKKLIIPFLKKNLEEKEFWEDFGRFFGFSIGTGISFVLSINFSSYFFFLVVPLLILSLIFIKILIGTLQDNYKYLLTEIKYLNNGKHLFYYYKSQKIEFELNTFNGKPHGKYIEFYENGQVKSSANYDNGKKDGKYIEFYENGQIRCQTNYVYGLLDGIYNSFYCNGNIFRESNFVNGKNKGEIKEFYKNGNIRFSLNGDKHIFFNKDGKKKCEAIIATFFLSEEKQKVDRVKTLMDKGLVDAAEIELNRFVSTITRGGWSVNMETGSKDSITIPSEHQIEKNTYKGVWRNFRDDGSVEYELDFEDPNSDREKQLVMKTLFTKKGNFFSKKVVPYEVLVNLKTFRSVIVYGIDSRINGELVNSKVKSSAWTAFYWLRTCRFDLNVLVNNDKTNNSQSSANFIYPEGKFYKNSSDDKLITSIEDIIKFE